MLQFLPLGSQAPHCSGTAVIITEVFVELLQHVPLYLVTASHLPQKSFRLPCACYRHIGWRYSSLSISVSLLLPARVFIICSDICLPHGTINCYNRKKEMISLFYRNTARRIAWFAKKKFLKSYRKKWPLYLEPEYWFVMRRKEWRELQVD